MVHGLEGEYWGRVDFVYLDIENPNNYSAVRARFGNVNVIPSFYILTPDGSFLYYWTGVEPTESTRNRLNLTLQSYPPQNPNQSISLGSGFERVIWLVNLMLSILY